jgi:LacI family transcriptional regulator
MRDKRKKLTITDIAKHFGVGVGTVSRAINDSGYVKQELKDQILAFVTENDWQASRVASALKNGKSKNIAFVVNTISSVHNQVIVERTIKGLSAKGFNTFVSIVGQSPQQQRSELLSLKGQMLDAIVITPYYPDVLEEVIDYFNSNGTRIILLENSGTVKCLKLSFDYESQARLAVRQLIEAGHRKILHIGALGTNKKVKNITDFDTNKYGEALAALSGTLKETLQAGIQLDINEDVVSDDYLDFSLVEEKLLTRKYTACFCDCSWIALEVYAISQKINLKIPDNISLVCLENNNYFKGFTPPPTCVEPKLELLADTLTQIITDAANTEHEIIYIGHELIKGGSILPIEEKKSKRAMCL